jgi:hypothetical protein
VGLRDSGCDVADQSGQATGELCSRMTVRPTRARRGLIEVLISKLMNAGMWAKLDGFYVFAAHDAQAAKLNWVGGMQDVTAVNAPLFQIDRGFTGDGAAAYLDTNTPANILEKHTGNDATMGVYVRTSTSLTNNVDISSGSGAYMNVHQGGNVVVRANSSAGSTILISNGGTGSGLFAWSRDASNVTLYRAGSSLGFTSVGIGSLASSNVEFLRHTSGTNYSARQLQVGLIGQGLSATEHAALNAAVVTYLTAIGAN